MIDEFKEKRSVKSSIITPKGRTVHLRNTMENPASPGCYFHHRDYGGVITPTGSVWPTSLTWDDIVTRTAPNEWGLPAGAADLLDDFLNIRFGGRRIPSGELAMIGSLVILCDDSVGILTSIKERGCDNLYLDRWSPSVGWSSAGTAFYTGQEHDGDWSDFPILRLATASEIHAAAIPLKYIDDGKLREECRKLLALTKPGQLATAKFGHT